MTQTEFEARVDGCRRHLLAIARSMLPREDCEDAVQSAILSAWEHLSKLRDEAAFEAWLTQILRNRCSQMLREKQKRSAVLDALKSKENEQPRDYAALNEALASLNAEDRRLLTMHHLHGDSLAEMAGTFGASEDVLKMRLFRARKRLKIALISLLIMLLLLAAAASTGYLDVNWFLANRRSTPQPVYSTDFRSVIPISYSGRLLKGEVSDVIWDLDALSLLFTYSITGTQSDALTVYSGNIGVDGERFDHIWADGQILPVTKWAEGKQVLVYNPDSWRIGSHYPTGSEDALPDGKGDTFFVSLFLGDLSPERYAALLDEQGFLPLTTFIDVENFTTRETIEQGELTIRVSAPTADTWRAAYEAYFD